MLALRDSSLRIATNQQSSGYSDYLLEQKMGRISTAPVTLKEFRLNIPLMISISIIEDTRFLTIEEQETLRKALRRSVLVLSSRAR